MILTALGVTTPVGALFTAKKMGEVKRVKAKARKYARSTEVDDIDDDPDFV